MSVSVSSTVPAAPVVTVVAAPGWACAVAAAAVVVAVVVAAGAAVAHGLLPAGRARAAEGMWRADSGSTAAVAVAAVVWAAR